MLDYESKGHNYQKKLLEFVRKHPELKGRLNLIQILHDDWCGVFKNRLCDCDPDISVLPDPRKN